MLIPRLFLLAAAAGLLALSAANFLPAGEPTTGKEKRERLNDISDLPSIWIYDDIAAGIAQAKQLNKPLFVVFR